MLVALHGTYTNLLEQAVLTHEVLLLGVALLIVGHQDLAIDQATEVRTLAPIALIERAMSICIGLRSAEVNIILVKEAIVFQETLFFSVDDSLFLNLLFEAHQRVQMLADGLGYAPGFDLLVALGAAHEGE